MPGRDRQDGNAGRHARAIADGVGRAAGAAVAGQAGYALNRGYQSVRSYMTSTDRDRSPPRQQAVREYFGGGEIDHEEPPPPEPEVNTGTASVAGGNTNHAASTPAIPRYTSVGSDMNSTRRHKFVTGNRFCYVVKPSAPASAHFEVCTIPWEFLRICHSPDAYAHTLPNSILWRPIKSHVIIKDVSNHAEINITADNQLPITFNNVRMMYADQNNPRLSWKKFPWVDDKKTGLWCRNWYRGQDNYLDDQVQIPTTWFGKTCKPGHILPVNKQVFNQYVSYTDPIWVEKHMTTDEQFRFEWAGSGPWRSTREFVQCSKLRVPSEDKVRHHNLRGFARFDYAVGQYELPRTTLIGDTTLTKPWYHSSWNPIERGYYHYTPQDIVNLTVTNLDVEKVPDIYTTDGLHEPGEDEQTINPNRYQWWDRTAHCQPYHDDNTMKPIIFRFDRIMRNNNEQKFRVYYTVEIEHEIEILEGNRVEQHYDKLDRRDGSETAGIKKAMNNPFVQTCIPWNYTLFDTPDSDYWSSNMDNYGRVQYRPVIYYVPSDKTDDYPDIHESRPKIVDPPIPVTLEEKPVETIET